MVNYWLFCIHCIYCIYQINNNVLQEDSQFKEALRIRNPKHRLKKILDACKNKKKCGGGEELEVQGQVSEEQQTKFRGGCGALRPTLRIEGMQIILEYKSTKGKKDDQELLPEPVERKQELSAEKVSQYEFVVLLVVR